MGAGPTLRVVSFNLRNARAFDGWNSWPFRRRATAEVLRHLDPDVAGLQEAYRIQERYLLRALRRYTSVSEGRSGDGRGERCPVLHKPTILRLVRAKTRWYSDHPDRPGSRLPLASFPRTATLVKLVHEASGRTFGVVGTHLDERHADNRTRSVELLLGWLEPGLPWLVVGDFNAKPGEEAVRRLLDAGLRSALPDDAGGTNHDWTGRVDGRRIDYILVSPEWDVVDGGVDHTRPRGRLPSDHWPVYADVRLAR